MDLKDDICIAFLYHRSHFFQMVNGIFLQKIKSKFLLLKFYHNHMFAYEVVLKF